MATRSLRTNERPDDPATLPLTTVLLDMNGTFMFDHDRYGPGEDFHATYRSLGGSRLEQMAVNDAVTRVVARLNELYRDRWWDTRFPTVAEVGLAVLGGAVAAPEHTLVEEVVALHELGSLSDAHAAALEHLSRRYTLVVVSNLWSNGDRWRDYLARRLSDGVLSHLVFSSDLGISKPAPGIFAHALELAGAEPLAAVMIGDDLERDIVPAAAMGMRTVWITGQSKRSPIPDRVVTDLCRTTDLEPLPGLPGRR